jgi:hypothetical protein
MFMLMLLMIMMMMLLLLAVVVVQGTENYDLSPKISDVSQTHCQLSSCSVSYEWQPPKNGDKAVIRRS